MKQKARREDGIEARAAVIDEYGDLKGRIAIFKPTQDRARKLEDEIRSWFDGKSPEASFQVEGARYVLQVSPQQQEREIFDMPKLSRLIGIQKFLEVCTLALKYVDALVPGDQHWRFLKQERTGNRKLTPILKMPERAA